MRKDSTQFSIPFCDAVPHLSDAQKPPKKPLAAATPLSAKNTNTVLAVCGCLVAGDDSTSSDG